MRGIAILVTCNYSGKLPATNAGADEMRKTFEKLGYIIYERRNENATKCNIIKLVEDLSTYLKGYGTKPFKNSDGREKIIAFAFSGRGGPDDQHDKDSMSLLTYDQQNLSLKEDILKPLVGIPRVLEIPKLFFIDASCELHQRPMAFQDEGNYRIDYSIIPEYAARVKWMPQLACKLREERMESVQDLAAIVKNSVQEEGGPRQQCDSIDRLINGPLYLHRW